MATLLLANGIPMVLAGDEFLRTQFGNNNAYSQDNKISWLNWMNISRHGQEMQAFVKSVLKLRRDYPVFKEIYELLSGNDTIKSRVRLQYLLSTMSAMNTVFSRTRKRDVTTDLSQAERKPHLCKIDLEENEQIIYDEIIQTYVNDNSYTDDWGEERMSQGISLGLVQKKRQVASSVYAYKNSDSDLDKGIDRYETYEDSKFNKLLEVLNEVKSKGRKKLIVFALFRKTLRYLEIRLKKRGIKCLVIHGLISDRANVLSRFEKDPTIEILLTLEYFKV